MEKNKSTNHFEWQAHSRASRGKWKVQHPHVGFPPGSPLLLYAPFDATRGSWIALDEDGLRAGSYEHRPRAGIDTATFTGLWDHQCSWAAGLQLVMKQTGQTFGK